MGNGHAPIRRISWPSNVAQGLRHHWPCTADADPRVRRPGGMPAAIRYYEELQGVEADAFLPFAAVSLYLAMVGPFLILEGRDEALAPFRETHGTLLVADVQPFYGRFLAAEAEIVWPIRDVPTGRGFNVRHADAW